MTEMKIIQRKPPFPNEVTIAIVCSRFNSFVVDKLYEGALKCLQANAIADSSITLVKVPGAFEIPVAVASLLEEGTYDAVITLGAVIRGETPHFDYICDACSSGISNLAIEYKKPVIFGVLTVDNVEQALDRAGDEESNKGYEAASAALEMIGVIKQIKS